MIRSKTHQPRVSTVLRAITVVLASTALLQSGPVASAVDAPAVTAASLDLSSWMGQLAPMLRDRPLNQIAMPGSHDAGSWGIHNGSGLCATGSSYTVSNAYPAVAASMARSQSGSLVDQLNGGSRYLDLRVCQQDGRWYLYHGSPLGGLFFDADGRAGEADQLAAWIAQHPTELVVISLSVTAPAPQNATAAAEAAGRLATLIGPGTLASRTLLSPTSTYGQILTTGAHAVLVEQSGTVATPWAWPSSSSSDRGSYPDISPTWDQYVTALFNGGDIQKLLDTTVNADRAALERDPGADAGKLFVDQAILKPDVSVTAAVLAQAGAALGLVSQYTADNFLLTEAHQLNQRILQETGESWTTRPAADHVNIVMTDDVNQTSDGVAAGALQRAVIGLNWFKKPTNDAPTRSASYQAHVANIGWQSFTSSNGTSAGTFHRSLGIEALRIAVKGTGGFSVRAHIHNIGWQGWRTGADGETVEIGTTGQGLPIEAVEIHVNTGTITARAYIQNRGWLPPATGNDVTVGTTGQSLRMEAITLTP